MLQNRACLKYFIQNTTLYEVTAMHHECTSTEAPLESFPGTGILTHHWEIKFKSLKWEG